MWTLISFKAVADSSSLISRFMTTWWNILILLYTVLNWLLFSDLRFLDLWVWWCCRRFLLGVSCHAPCNVGLVIDSGIRVPLSPALWMRHRAGLNSAARPSLNVLFEFYDWSFIIVTFFKWLFQCERQGRYRRALCFILVGEDCTATAIFVQNLHLSIWLWFY